MAQARAVAKPERLRNFEAAVERPAGSVVNFPAPTSAPVPRPRSRVDAVDLARGFAVALMILSHGVKGLLDFSQIPAWGMVPIHLVTKFSSTLFILVFGVAMAITQLPHVGTPSWPARRNKLLLRGFVVLFFYKVLTIVEMFALYSKADILKTLSYEAFPVYVEILGFYAIALLWVPLVLPVWKKTPLALKLAAPVALALLAHYLYHHFGFFGSDSLQAILVEHDKHYTWGQLARGPLILVGLLYGEYVLRQGAASWKAWAPLLVGSAALFGAFLLLRDGTLAEAFTAIARNEGKHPPERDFMLFSAGGALALFGIAFLGGKKLAHALSPITLLGKDALQAFVCHIFVLFVFYRYLFSYWKNVSYEQALVLTGVMMGVTALWIRARIFLKDHS